VNGTLNRTEESWADASLGAPLLAALEALKTAIPDDPGAAPATMREAVRNLDGGLPSPLEGLTRSLLRIAEPTLQVEEPVAPEASAEAPPAPPAESDDLLVFETAVSEPEERDEPPADRRGPNPLLPVVAILGGLVTAAAVSAWKSLGDARREAAQGSGAPEVRGTSPPTAPPRPTSPPSVTPPVSGAGPAPAADPSITRPKRNRSTDLPNWLRSTLEPLLGDRYLDLTMLGTGGMGAVVKARDVQLDRIVAIKVPPPHMASDGRFMARFLREARALARLDHPNIARVFDVPSVPEGEVPVMVMEYLQGEDLQKRLETGGPASVPEIAMWTRQAGAALQHAHDQGILHRDVKPANLLLVGGRTVKLLDFGLAVFDGSHTLTASGVMLGSYAYMPPEQIRGERVGAAADQYSLAASILELLVGEMPFAMDDHQRVAPKLPSNFRQDIPEAAEQVLLQALSPKVDERFDSVLEFAGAFVQSLASGSSGPPPAAASA
jgi:hypothetical protein